MASTYMKEARQQELDRLGSKPLLTQDKTVQHVVESWNWNLSIFEIYDEIRDWKEHDIKNVLTYAYHFFGDNKGGDTMINELHVHLIGWGVMENNDYE